MPLDSDLLRRSFTVIAQRAPDLTRRFYDVLFTKYPTLLPLFPAERRHRQEEMLARALGFVVDHLDDPRSLASELRALGQRHVRYGVHAEMYPWVGDALLTTLAEAAGDQWSDALHAEWTRAYQTIASLMLGAERVERQAPASVDDGMRRQQT